MGHYSVIKKNKIMPFATTWMDLEIIILSKVIKRKNTIWYHLHVESKIWHKWTYLQNRNKRTDRGTDLGLPRERRMQEEWIRSSGFSSVQFSSVAQSCPTLCDPMNRSQASLSITNSQSLPKLISIESVMPSSHLILLSPSPPAPNPSQHQSLFRC